MLHNLACAVFGFVFLFSLEASSFFGRESVIVDSSPRCVVLLHGLGRTWRSMRKIEKRLLKRGFVVWNEGYPSTSQSVEELSLVIDEALLFCRSKNARSVSFVTHSLGGILVRQYFQDRPVDGVEAVVMLAPPNHGSEVTDAFKDAWWFQYYTGVAGGQLGTDENSLPNQLKPINVPIGVIAGTVSSDPWFSHVFSGPNDGKVSVESAKLAEMTDFITVPTGHTFIMTSPTVIDQVVYYLTHKKFKNEP